MYWWELGLVNRQMGDEFSPSTLACPYCSNKGSFSRVFRAERTGNSSLEDYFSDVWQCQVCAQESFVQWHAEKGTVDYRVYPPSIRHGLVEILPGDLADEYQQAVNAYITEKWDVAMVLSRRVMDMAARKEGIHSESLLDAIAQLTSQGLLTRHMERWAASITALNPGAVSAAATQEGARVLLIFTRWVLDLLYLLPNTSERYR